MPPPRPSPPIQRWPILVPVGLLAIPTLVSWIILRPGQQSPALPALLILLLILTLWLAALGFLFVRRHLEIQVRMAEERYVQQQLLRAATDAAGPVALIATDPSGIIQLFNVGAEQLLGLRSQDLLHQATPERYHLPEELAARGRELTEELGRPIQGFEVLSALPCQSLGEARTWTLRHADGRPMPVNLTVTALRGLRGDLFGFLLVARTLQVPAARETAPELGAPLAAQLN